MTRKLITTNFIDKIRTTYRNFFGCCSFKEEGNQFLKLH